MWVVVIMVLGTQGAYPEVVAGDYFTLADCTAVIRFLADEHGTLLCTRRRAGLKDHEAYSLGD